jgi:predicted SprT family Zn-dependent metalloprotease
MAKDLTKELYFSENVLTSFSEVEKLANELLCLTWEVGIYRFAEPKKINLKDLGWQFEFNSRKRAAGLCRSRNKTIYISEWLLKQNLSKSMEFENTIRHEIAHALDFVIRGFSNHDNVWKFIAKTILCDGERCYTSEQIGVTEKTKYTLICDNCGKTSPSHKEKKKKVACGDCCRKHSFGRYDEKYVLRQVRNW